MNGKLIVLAFLLFVAVSSTVLSVQALRPNYVYDRANILDTESENAINNFLEEVDRNSTAEIVVVTLANLDEYGGGSDTAQARNIIFNDESLSGVKGIGDPQKDNGVLLLLVVEGSDNKPHSGIEVGYGLEGNLTDGRSGRILDDYVMPALRAGNYSQAAYDGVKAIAETAVGTSSIAAEDNASFDQGTIGIIVVLVVAVALFIVIGGRRRRHGGVYSGGGFGGGGSGGGGYGGGGSGGGGAGRIIPP